MKRIISMIARLAIMALILVPAVPAGANHPNEVTASVTVSEGNARLTVVGGTGFWFPVSNNSACDPVCPGLSGRFTLTLGDANGFLSAGVLGHYAYVPPTATVATVKIVTGTVSGDVTAGTAGLGAWCGYSRGVNGAGAIVTELNFGVTTTVTSLSDVTWIQSAATLIQSNGVAASGVLSGTIHSLSSAIPIPEPGVSCAQGNQIDFRTVSVSLTLLT